MNDASRYGSRTLIEAPRALIGMLVALVLGGGALAASDPPDRESAAVRQAYLDLTAAHRVLHVVSAPGREDLTALAWCRRGLGLRTAVLYLTSGARSAASSIPDQVATRVDAARRVARELGSECRFGHLPKVGDDEPTVERIVRAIRWARPHVLLVEGGNEPGQQAIHRAVVKAIAAAADRTRFDDHLQDLLYPWRVARAFVGVTASDTAGRKEAAGAALCVVPANGVAATWGKTYYELGRAAAGRSNEPSASPVAYRSFHPSGPIERAGDGAEAALTGGIVAFDRGELGLRKDEDYERVRGIEAKINAAGRALLTDGATIDEALSAFNALCELNDQPYASRRIVPGEFIDEVGFQYYFRVRLPQVSAAMMHALRIHTTFEIEPGERAPGERFAVDVRVAIDGDTELENVVVGFPETESFRVVYHGQGRRRLTAKTPVIAETKILVREKAAPVVPAWARPNTWRGAAGGLVCAISGRYAKVRLGFSLPVEPPPVRAAVSLVPGASCVHAPADRLSAGVQLRALLRTDGPLFIAGGRPKDRPMRFKVWATAPDGVAVEPNSRFVEVRRAGETVPAVFTLGGALNADGTVILHAQCVPADGDGQGIGPEFTTTVPIVTAAAR